MKHSHTFIFPEDVAMEKFKVAPTHPWTTEVISSSILDAIRYGQKETRFTFKEAQENFFSRPQQDRIFNDNQVDTYYLIGSLLLDNLPKIRPQKGKSVEVTISWDTDDDVNAIKFDSQIV